MYSLYIVPEICYVIKMKEVNPMKKHPLFTLLYQIASPLALILAGLVLLLFPDTASALISRILGWGLTLAGILSGIWAIFDRRRAVSKGIAAVSLVCIGGFLTANPLLLAAFVGRIIGLLIALRGIREVFLSRSLGRGQLLAGILTAAGILLMVLPMTASRLVFSACGLVVTVTGVLMLLEKLRQRQLPPDKPDIIDAL